MAADTLATKKAPVNTALKRYRLRTELKAARQAADLTQREVAQTLDWSPSKIIRIESGDVSVSTTDLKALLETYHIQDRFADLSELARGSRKQPWAHYSDLFSAELRQFFSYEASAQTIRQSESVQIPALLQTDAYAVEIMTKVYGTATSELERHLEVRRARRQILEPHPNRPVVRFVLAEPVLQWQVGGPSIMRQQLEAVREVAQSGSGISIQILPLGVGANFGMRGTFVHLEFGPEDQDVLFLDDPVVRKVFRDEVDLVAEYRRGFTSLQATASQPAELDRFLDKAIADL